MRANDYIEKYGIYNAKRLIETAPLDKRDPSGSFDKPYLNVCVDVKKLKNLVDSYKSEYLKGR